MEFSPLLIYAAIFVAILLLIGAIYLLFFGKSIEHSNAIDRRLNLVEKSVGKADALEQLRKERARKKSAFVIPVYGVLQERAAKAALSISVKTLFLLMLLIGSTAFVAMTIATDIALIARVVLAGILGYSSVYLWVSRKAKKRVDAIEEQLAEAIDLIVRSLRVGHPFGSAIAMAGDEVPDPLGSEFRLISDEIAYGRDAGEAISEFAERVDLQDLRFLAVSVSIQQKSGGNLADILEGLSKVVRARFKLFRRVRAITAEAQWSGKFLSAFPIIAMLLMLVLKPDYYDDVKDMAIFMPLVIIVLFLLAINLLYMRKMTNLKV